MRDAMEGGLSLAEIESEIDRREGELEILKAQRSNMVQAAIRPPMTAERLGDLRFEAERCANPILKGWLIELVNEVERLVAVGRGKR